MERVTKHSNDLIRDKAIDILRGLSGENMLSGDELSTISAYVLLERVENKNLKAYEDAEEQGLILRSPCKVGDTVYCLMSAKTKIVETSILWIEKHSNCLVFALAGGFGDVVSENLGKTWFFTKEEAEQALARMEGENE